uniref:NELL2-interacting cell ontogeny regulator 1 n=1 Tax=Xenopus tropicalis TaxID=8364 RepID=A0A6I8R8M3_XENTR
MFAFRANWLAVKGLRDAEKVVVVQAALIYRYQAMPSRSTSRCIYSMLFLMLTMGLPFMKLVLADEPSGTTIPPESRPCVDCHAFEFMQRALQDLKKTAYNLDSRTETLLLKVERRSLCDCITAEGLS